MFVGIMVTRNEKNVIAYSMAHLLYSLEVDQLIIVDNSEDDTPAIIARAAAIAPRVVYIGDRTPFSADLINGPAREAWSKGATWIVPNDADEFLWAPVLDRRNIDVKGVGLWEMDIVNFVQRTSVKQDDTHTLASMKFSARPQGNIESAMSLVGDEKISFVEMAYPPKVIARAAKDLHIVIGHHNAVNIDGEVRRLPEHQVLHAPLRARDAIYKRMGYAHEIPGDRHKDESWHLRRYLKIEGQEKAIDREWAANSTSWGRLGVPSNRSFGRRDLRLAQTTAKHRAFVDRVNGRS